MDSRRIMLPAPCPTFSFHDDVTNGLETYSIVETISAGERCTVYRVICKSGRLRNRELALKKVPRAADHLPDEYSSALSIHLTLHHPNIVSLFSSFSSSLDHFHVLELCSVGTLQDFLYARDSRALTENELRGVVKSICDALTYLRKEFVVHRDIKPSNVMLTGDYGIKLSGFGLSTRLYSMDSTVPFVQGSFNYTAPEALSNTPYGFAIDVWSMGCVMVACLSGKPPFQGKTIPEVLENISLSEYTLPTDLLGDTKNLIAGILQSQPENRTTLPQISSHPFLMSPVATVTPLRPTRELLPSVVRHKSSFKGRSQNEKNPPISRKAHSQSGHPSINFLETPVAGKARVVLKDIVNTELRVLLQNEIITNIPSTKPYLAAPVRRIVSDPVSTSKGYRVMQPVSVGENPDNALSPAVSLPPLSNDNLAADSPRSPSRASAEHGYVPHSMTATSRILQTLPVGTTRPVQFTTAQLNCQTHKTTYGQITILPSRSVLVDFRESQRRKGLKGDEVFVVDPSGVQISVYNAPHLSSPCCLVEPTQQFLLQALPSTYWKQYNDAGRLIDQIKQRTPKLVLYTAAAKCTLMANTPQGDIEVTLRGNLASGVCKGRNHDNGSKGPSMRIRLSRQCQSIELAQHLAGVRSEEWTKKHFSATKEPPYMSENDWSSLNQAEQEAMNHLACFVRKCETLEVFDLAEGTHISSMDRTSTMLETPVNSQLNPTVISGPPGRKVSHTLSSINLAPRPRFSMIAAPRSTTDKNDDTICQREHPKAGSADGLVANSRNKLDGIDLPMTWFVSDPNGTNGNQEIQTRFIPSVGWCVRYPSSVSQGGRYMIMFLDGVALVIDVDEDWVEFRSQSGEATKHKILECNSKRKIGERMKVFEEFVSLFDDSQQQSIL